ncbi:hypothetical protein AAC387_Pa07g1923 [Persea americana]
MEIIAPVLDLVKPLWSAIGHRIGCIKNLNRNMDALEKNATHLFKQLLEVQEIENTEQLKVATEECQLWIIMWKSQKFSKRKQCSNKQGAIFTSFENDGEALTWWRKKMLDILLAYKPVGAVGASPMLGASSLSRVVPMSTFMKLITYKIPAFVKIGLAHTQRTTALALLTEVLGR